MGGGGGCLNISSTIPQEIQVRVGVVVECLNITSTIPQQKIFKFKKSSWSLGVVVGGVPEQYLNHSTRTFS